MTYTIRELDASTWGASAELVERNNGGTGEPLTRLLSRQPARSLCNWCPAIRRSLIDIRTWVFSV